MTKDEFWALIQSTRRANPEEHAERLVSTLAKQGTIEILSFAHWWSECIDRGYSWSLWGAAYLIRGGCSDDSFTDFRSWLILQGEEVFEAAVKDPDSLASISSEMDDCTCECYPAQDVYVRATGVSGHDSFYLAYDEKYGQQNPVPELGEGWDFDDEGEMRKRHPRLFEHHK